VVLAALPVAASLADGSQWWVVALF